MNLRLHNSVQIVLALAFMTLSLFIIHFIGCTDHDEKDSNATPTPTHTPTPRDITFRKIFGGKSSDTGNFAEQTSDGGYIFCGYTKSFDSIGMDVYLVKTNQYGNEIWTKTLGGSGYQEGICVRQTRDSGFIITGSTYEGSSGSSILLIKTDNNGNEEWSRTLPGIVGYSVQQTNDNGFIISGWTFQAEGGYTDVYLIKTNSEGDETWSRRFGKYYSDCGYSVQQTRDGGYVICGEWNYSYPHGESKIFLLKTNGDGNKEWISFFGDEVYNFGYCVTQTNEGGYILCGSEGNNGAVLIKTDDKGIITWSQNYDHSFHRATSVEQTGDDGYIVCGSCALENYYSALYLLKTDSLGNEVWSRIFQKNDTYCRGYSVQQTKDEGYILCGTISYESRDSILIKTDKRGNVENVFD